MKRIVITMVAAVLMTSAALAQDKKDGNRPEKKFDKTEMVKHRTAEVVKKYSLNDKQAKAGSEVNVGDVIHIEFGNSSVTVRVRDIIESARKETAQDMYEILQ